MATLPVEIIILGDDETRKTFNDAVVLLNAHQDAYAFSILDLPDAETLEGASRRRLSVEPLGNRRKT